VENVRGLKAAPRFGGTLKSNVSDYLELVEHIYIDASAKCSADVSDLRDLETIRSRVENEGISFLTITLPQFCRDFERSLADGGIARHLFSGFVRVRGGSIPVFLQGMTKQIFNWETGKVLQDEESPSNRGVSSDIPTVIESVRQLCLTFKKLALDCTPKRVQSALDSFISIEQSLESFSVPNEDYDEFLDVSSVLWDNMVADFSVSTLSPQHGPGATAEKISGNQKFLWRRWHDRLEPYFPLIHSGYPLGTPEDSEELKIVSIVPEADEQPVRVVTVPKTLKSPRIIAIEPCCMQYTQQAIRSYLYDKIESYWLTRGHVNFRDQSINQQLAMTASKTGQLATIDLSDASDRVPRSLALVMLQANPDLRDSVDACRSRSAQLPDGRLVSPLLKFASMGSALCFPIEAMYFYTICVIALLRAQNLSATSSNVYSVTRELYVYGDDIIVPSTYADFVLDYLQKYNCKVNTNKTFWSGSFRESCGVDAYDGYEVTPTYVHHPLPENKRQTSAIISGVATANLFYKKGYWRTTQFMFNKLEQVIGTIPYVSETSEALGRISFLGYESSERWNPNLQRHEIRALVPSPVYRTDKLEGYGALMKCFSGKSEGQEDLWVKRLWTLEANFDYQERSELERSARHGAVALKRRWVTPH
jgi:hypothetical protein